MWVKGKGSVRSTYTVFFKHKHITNPTVTPEDAIVNSAKELTVALKGNVPGSLGATSLDDLKNWKKYCTKGKELQSNEPSSGTTSKGEG